MMVYGHGHNRHVGCCSVTAAKRLVVFEMLNMPPSVDERREPMVMGPFERYNLNPWGGIVFSSF
jgi:hypothetical protein